MTDTTAATSTIPMVKVKTERPDEAEIRELAAKMVEANKAKALAASVAAARPPPGGMVGVAPPGSGGQMGIINFLSRKPGANAATAEQRPAPEGDKKTPAPDEASWKGHFGWDMLGKCHIPYIYRSNERYVAVRMVEIKLLNKYLNYLHADIYSCTCIRSYYITEIEARLLNEINNRHCDGQFGREPFTQKDLVVRLSDAYEFYNFLDVCYNKLLRGTTNSKDKCGFIRINKESVVPYTVRDSQKFVPLFYFEGETDNLKLKADQLKGWDLSYLKFCCKVQGIRNELFASETCSVISLTDIKSYFPPGTEFEEYWPNKVVDSQLLISAKGSVSGGGQWTRAPPAPPPGVVGGVGVGAGAGVNLNNVTSQSTRGRRAATQRHSPASAAMQMPHAGLSAAAVQALASGWNLPNTLTQAQTAQVLRLAQAQVAQAHVARYNNAIAAAASLPQHRSQHQRNVQFPNSAITMAMGQQPPPPLVRSTANTTTMKPKTGKTYAQRQKEYRERKKMEKLLLHGPKKKPKTNAQCQQEFRQKQKQIMLQNETLNLARKKSNAERAKRYRDKLKSKKRAELNSALSSEEDSLHRQDASCEELMLTQFEMQLTELPPSADDEDQRAISPSCQSSEAPGEDDDECSVPDALLHQHTSIADNAGVRRLLTNEFEYADVPPQVTGTMNGHSTSHSMDSRKRLTPIPDVSITGNHTPYRVQKALVENTMVPCINAKPYQYTELLMTLPDLASYFFPRVSLTTCRAMLDALGITLYKPNSTQLQVLRNSGKCKYAAAGENGMALVSIRDVMAHMPQFKYMLRSGHATDEPPQAPPRPAHAPPPPQPKRARAN